jgi:hypothetical protein
MACVGLELLFLVADTKNLCAGCKIALALSLIPRNAFPLRV